jgi:hypothetical protein
VVRANREPPALGFPRSKIVLEEELADLGVVGFGEGNLPSGQFIKPLRSEPDGALGLKSESDFPDVMEGGERGGAGGEELPDRTRGKIQHGGRHTAHIAAVTLDGNARDIDAVVIGNGLGPETHQGNFRGRGLAGRWRNCRR